MLNRVSWGADTSSAQMLAAEGVERYLQSQLHPSPDDGLPKDAQIEIAAMDISQKTLPQIQDDVRAMRAAAQQVKGTPDYEAAQKAFQRRLGDYARQAAMRSLLRDLYSKNQLKEQLTWFWMNHFNVSQNKADIRALVGDYEENAIRPHVLGKFRDLLAATAFHPAMLQYLDNAQNAVGHINENYAREIMELHTMGVGSGYTQKDVQELARILTGVGVNLSGKMPNVRSDLRGAISRRESIRIQSEPPRLRRQAVPRHDHQGRRAEGGRRSDRHSERRARRRHITSASNWRSIFCCDTPPDSLIEAMAATFRARDGDIAARAANDVHSARVQGVAEPEIQGSDPLCRVVIARRLWRQVILNAQPLLNWLNRMSEPLYGHETPDGYALDRSGVVRARRDGDALRDRAPDRPGPFRPVQTARRYGEGTRAAAGYPGYALLSGDFADAWNCHSGRACAGEFADGLEYAVPVLAGVHASLAQRSLVMNRRELLKTAAATLPLTFVAGRLYATPAANPPRLLVVFLRGAYDAANIVIPASSDFYYSARPTLAVPKDGVAAARRRLGPASRAEGFDLSAVAGRSRSPLCRSPAPTMRSRSSFRDPGHDRAGSAGRGQHATIARAS